MTILPTTRCIIDDALGMREVTGDQLINGQQPMLCPVGTVGVLRERLDKLEALAAACSVITNNATICCRTEEDTGDGIVTLRFAHSKEAYEFAEAMEAWTP